jgi:hypothetical protein
MYFSPLVTFFDGRYLLTSFPAIITTFREGSIRLREPYQPEEWGANAEDGAKTGNIYD